jgi:DNA-binding response OmpR family regulator
LKKQISIVEDLSSLYNVRLPCRAAERRPITEGHTLMKTRIMVINNSDDILALFQKILATEDCQVFTQLFLNSDLREVRQIKPDLIILDYYVGREGVGWEFLQLLKMEDSTSEIPVLICTTAVQLVNEIAAYLATKQVTVLRKPFGSRDLIHSVQAALQDKHFEESSSAPSYKKPPN